MHDNSHNDSDKLIGQVIANRYLIVDLLGCGGMGMVYKATHQLMKRTVAIKILHQHLGSDIITVKRFQQEAQAVSSLNHPNIIAVHDFGVCDAGPYLCMDYLNGVNLADVIAKEGFIAADRCLNIFTQACDALAHAHSKGIIHRDLKPSNIMLIETENEPDFVKLVDFGIAKILPQEGEQLQKLTQTGEVFGSPVYMSPEQVMGQAMDARSDIYSLGCLMYEALVGRPPLLGDNMLETMYKHLHDTPQPLKIGKTNAIKVERLEAVVSTALLKEPSQRYQSMDEIRQDLQLILEDTPGGRAQRRISQRRAAEARQKLKQQIKTTFLVVTSILIIGLLCLAAIFFDGLARRQYILGNRGPLFLQTYREQDTAAEKLLPNSMHILGESAYRALSRARSDTDPHKITLLTALGRFYYSQKRYDEAADIYRSIIKCAKAQGDLSVAINALEKWADCCRAQDNFKQAGVILRYAITLNTQGNRPQWYNAANLIKLSQCYYQQKDYLQAALCLKQAGLTWQHYRLHENDNTVVLLNNLGAVCCLLKDYPQAEIHLRDSLTCLLVGNLKKEEQFEKRLEKHLNGQDKGDLVDEQLLAQGLNNLAYVLAQQHRYPEAERWYKQAIKILSTMQLRQSLTLARIENNYANMLWLQHRYLDWFQLETTAEPIPLN
jgi:tetratricopeptide (TPR) repeat protein/tRNA A-37 threonylcarbamoyl transferase component Bud32